MSEFRLIESQTIPLTRELAKQFHQMTPSPTERPLDPRRVRHLKEKAESGLLVNFHWAKVKVGNQIVRMNGQHSSSMLTGLNGQFPEGLYVHMDEYEATDANGQALLFRQFDDRKSGRSPGDVAGAYQGLYKELADVPRPTAKMAIEGIAWYDIKVQGIPRPTGDDVYSMFRERIYDGFLHWVGEVLGLKQPEMKRVQLCSALYGTFTVNEAMAKEFWDHVARGGVEYEESHPASVLSRWLVDAKNREFKTPPKPAHFYQAGIYAWNALREQKELKSMNIDKLKNMLEPIA